MSYLSASRTASALRRAKETARKSCHHGGLEATVPSHAHIHHLAYTPLSIFPRFRVLCSSNTQALPLSTRAPPGP
jgi:hypothetical protein